MKHPKRKPPKNKKEKIRQTVDKTKTKQSATHSSKRLKPNKNAATQEQKPYKPPKFSWIVENLLAGHGRPTKEGHVIYLQNCGIKNLITLTENKPTILHAHPGGFKWHHIPVKDEKPPSQDQVLQFIQAVDQCKKANELVSVHCAWGRGRTGTFGACYLAHYFNLSASEAIKQIRTLRPGSIDTPEQEKVVKDYVTCHGKGK